MPERQVLTIVDAVRAHWLAVLACGLIVGVLVGGFAWLSSPAATAQGTLGLTSPPPGNVLLPVPAGEGTMAQYVSQRALFATSDVVLGDAARSLPGLTVEQLRESTKAVPGKNGNSIVFSANADTPTEAASNATAVMAAYRNATAADVELRAEAKAKANADAGASEDARRAVAEGQAFGDGVEFEIAPSLEGSATRKALSKEAVLGLLIGLGGAALIAWAREDAKQRRQA